MSIFKREMCEIVYKSSLAGIRSIVLPLLDTMISSQSE